ncbi:MAG: transcriptional initiation protein Tat [Rhizomicrobium sp.]
MTLLIHRRAAIISSGVAIATGAAALASPPSQAAEADLIPPGARTLSELNARLAKAPRRRDFKTVPMILNDPSQWDHEALSEVMAYKGAPKQAFDNSDIAAPWLNLMRNALNGQIWSFRHPDCLVVSATHGTAHLALYDQATWEKYQLSTIAGEKFKTNTLILETAAGSADPLNYESPEGPFSSHDSTIPALQRRGVVFLACHNAMWELSEKLIAAGVNPDKLTPDAMAAEFTNHLIPDVVVTPGIVATLPELQRVGFFYNK